MKLVKTFGLLLLICVGAVALFLGLCFVFVRAPDIEPVPFHPQPAPGYAGALSRNRELTKASLLASGKLNGPEDVAVDRDGAVYAGNEDGTIVRILPNGTVKSFADTGGRPLGLKSNPREFLIVADAVKGLLAIDSRGQITPLVQSSARFPIGMADDLDVTSAGIVYFSDATSPTTGRDYYQDILIHKPFGRLLKYDLFTSQLGIALDSLYFANGVALSPDEDFVLVTETSQYQVTRLWLKGPRKGQRDIFAKNLPGFPDGISGDGNGNYWVALFSPRKSDVDRIYSPRVWLKKVLMHLPAWARPKGTRYGLIIQLNSQGEIVKSLHDPEGEKLSGITNVVEENGKLYIGTLAGDAIGIYDL